MTAEKPLSPVSIYCILILAPPPVSSPGRWPNLLLDTATIHRPKYQRVLNNLQMARLTCGRMIHFLAHSFPPLSCQQDVYPSLSFLSVVIKLTDATVVGRVGPRSQIIPPRESLAFFRSFNTLCPNPMLTSTKSMVFRKWGNPTIRYCTILILKNCKIFPCLPGNLERDRVQSYEKRFPFYLRQ